MGAQLLTFYWDSWGTPECRSPPCRRVLFAEFRCQREVVMIFGLDIWAGLPGGVGSLMPAQGGEGTLAASIAREAHNGAALPWGRAR